MKPVITSTDDLCVTMNVSRGTLEMLIEAIDAGTENVDMKEDWGMTRDDVRSLARTVRALRKVIKTPGANHHV